MYAYYCVYMYCRQNRYLKLYLYTFAHNVSRVTTTEQYTYTPWAWAIYR